CPVNGRWWDIGTPASYLQANLDWLAQHAGPGRESYIAPSASVAPGVSIGSSIVGAGARVLGPGALDQCVIWPGSTAVAPLARCVVTPRVVVAVGPAAPAP